MQTDQEIIIGNIFALHEPGYFEKCERKPYDSFEDIVADGWQVD